MIVALWIIAVCEIIRAVQNMLQISMMKHNSAKSDNAYAEFIKSLKDDDKEFVKKMLTEFQKNEAEDDNPVVGVKLNLDGSWSEVRKND